MDSALNCGSPWALHTPRVKAALESAGIPVVPAEAGIFVLCDMRSFLAEASWEAEHALWRQILDGANVNITPGSACRIAEPGFMRLCYAAEPIESVLGAIERVGRLLEVQSRDNFDLL